MVEEQIQRRGIQNKAILKVMRETPRHRFIPLESRGRAYGDHPLPIGDGQTISQPYIVALMTDLLQVDTTHKVLEIGTGSGYQAAVLAPLAKWIYTIEIVKPLADRAQNTLKKLGYNNITVKYGDGYKGWPEFSPFDRIIVTAAPPEIPPALVDQLKPGGIMVLPVGSIWQELMVISKNESGEIKRKTIIPVRFVPMVHPK